MIAFRLKPGHVAPLASLVRAVATTGDVERASVGFGYGHNGCSRRPLQHILSGPGHWPRWNRFASSILRDDGRECGFATAWIFLIGYRLFRLGQE